MLDWLAKQDLDDLRPRVAIVAIALAVITIVILYFTLPDWLAAILLDKLRFPISVQTGMWLTFYVAMGEIIIRRISADREMRELSKEYLPEQFKTVLLAGDLPDIYRKLRTSPALHQCFLPRLIDRC